MREFTSTHRRLGRKVLELREVAKSYDGRQVLAPFSYDFRRGERIGIIGPNGSGKSTFLRLVGGEVAPDAGSVVKGETTVFAHLDQAGGVDVSGLTVIEYIRELAERVPADGGGTLAAEQLLERFLFPRSMQGLALARLSGGELRRLHLVRLLASAPNFLLLDEPTSDLDLDTIRALEDYLAEFPGCLLIVSHDRALLARLTDALFVFDGSGGIRGFTGSYDEYREAVATEQKPEEPSRIANRPPVERPRKQGLSFGERREYERLLGEIEELEAESRGLEAAFQAPVRDPAALERGHRRYREIAALLEASIARWEDLAARAGD